MTEMPIRVATKFEDFGNAGVDILWPVHLEPKIPTMDKKLIINVAPVGGLISRKQNPTQPYNAKEIANDAIEGYKAGAAMWHVHCRENGGFSVNVEEYKKTMDLVFKKAPDIITNLCTVWSPNFEGEEGRMKPMVEPLKKYGDKYAEMALINPISFGLGPAVFISTPAGVEEEVKYLEKVKCKPELVGYNHGALDVIFEHAVNNGLAKKPILIDIAAGIHNASPTTPDPEGIVNLIQMARRVMGRPGVVWQAIIGGHNWLPLTVVAIMLGADIVRVGKEDMVYMYPHKDDIITSCGDAVKKIATIARELGREIATPAEARKVLGLKTPKQ